VWWEWLPLVGFSEPTPEKSIPRNQCALAQQHTPNPKNKGETDPHFVFVEREEETHVAISNFKALQ
jgi:hypothetical protein